MDTTALQRVEAQLWTDGLAEHEGTRCELEAVRDEFAATVALHTFIDGRGSMIGFALDRERAIALASAILEAVKL